MSKPEDVERLVKTTVDEFGRVDILVNNAGVHFTDDSLEATEAVWDKTMDTNLKGAYLCSKEVAPIVLKHKKGKIINVSSNSGLYHSSAMRYVEYVTSKAGMNGLTKTHHPELVQASITEVSLKRQDYACLQTATLDLDFQGLLRIDSNP